MTTPKRDLSVLRRMARTLSRRISPGVERHVIWLPQAQIGYFRIGKAANTSIRTALAQAFGLTSAKGLRPAKDAFWSRQPRHLVRRMRPATYALSPATRAGWSFSFVRHPVARLYSCWHNKVIENPVILPAMADMGIDHGMPFDDFVALVACTPDAKTEIHLRSQASILTWHGRVLPDFIGRVEDAETDWAHVRWEIRMRCGTDPGPMLRRNIRGQTAPEIAETLSPKTLALISERYAEDFRLFYSEADDASG
ncbi:sulfotransferase family 2 domain-containing protein [uncultured Roseovarius sp.]|uniref:sulfotransferase family 2 domain-containing protein n=1 Tax=uncultured Roseovarius sp. TaxID=293344 RepID=UPI002606EFC6|nr:sulfotransferase family 2 domain-containing protein [uncultured Roseovarius sp.]